MTKRERVILTTLFNNQEFYGLAISRATEFWMSTVYTVLHRLERDGLVTSRWGDEGPDELTTRGGARRRYYKITEAGKIKAILDEAKSKQAGSTKA